MKQTENEMNVSVPLEVIKASDIEPKEVKWLWYPYIPFGKVTLLQGDPGDGKSKLRQHRTIAEASAVESPIRQETIGFPAHFFARAHNFKPPGRACQPEADSPMRT